MSNIITNADVKKFLTLTKAGMKHGIKKELRTYTSALHESEGEGYYVDIEFRFRVGVGVLEELFEEDDFDATNDINDLLKGL